MYQEKTKVYKLYLIVDLSNQAQDCESLQKGCFDWDCYNKFATNCLTRKASIEIAILNLHPIVWQEKHYLGSDFSTMRVHFIITKQLDIGAQNERITWWRPSKFNSLDEIQNYLFYLMELSSKWKNSLMDSIKMQIFWWDPIRWNPSNSSLVYRHLCFITSSCNCFEFG